MINAIQFWQCLASAGIQALGLVVVIALHLELEYLVYCINLYVDIKSMTFLKSVY